jgi:glycosyltransferase involved in cell wall biosynthesis
MRLGILLSELFFKIKNFYVSKSVSYNFFKNFEEFDKIFMGPVGNGYKLVPDTYNAKIEAKEFIELPFFDSIYSFGIKYYFNFRYRKEVREIFLKFIENNDIIWARNPSLASIILSEMTLKNNKPLISHICADIEFSWKNPKYKGIKKVLAFLMSNYILYKLKKITKNSNTYTLCTGEKLFNQFKKLNEDNTYFFIDSLIRKNSLQKKSKLENNFLYVGRLTIEKGILDLIEACKFLVEKNIQFTLDIVGFGPLESKIKEIINLYNLESYINFIGYVSYNNLEMFYKRNSFFILPSNADYEGFPRVILEAWSYGMPVITTDVGGIKGLGKHEKNVFFVERNNPVSIAKGMEKLINDELLKNKMKNYIVKNRDIITFEYQKKLVLNIVEKIENKSRIKSDK